MANVNDGRSISMADNEALAPFRLNGKKAIVTGAASGIGRATAELFSQVGADVLFVDLDGDAAKAAADAVGAASAACDISDDEQVARLFADAKARLGRLDVLANVAAYRRKADTMTMPAAEWDIMHAVTTRGTFLCLREAIRIMREQPEGGSIVNVSSVSAAHPTIFSNMHYDSAKAGVDAMTRAAAIEFAGHRIRVNSIQPGATASGGAATMQTNLQTEFTPSGPITQPGRIALGRSSQPIEQARAILFLASDAASYITGQHLAIDGGFSVS
jgi:NAD(P)-dependent dehydrogenase (short-subunit alcohol dehydrogenase family)